VRGTLRQKKFKSGKQRLYIDIILLFDGDKLVFPDLNYHHVTAKLKEWFSKVGMG
jgi:hypothetical protein